MITAKIQGGVGNQMFIIAATYALALNNGDECAFDMDVRRKYYGVVHQGRVASLYFGSLYKKVKHLPLGWDAKTYYKENSDNPYAPIPYKPYLLIEGYFQSEKHFADRRRDIIKLFIDSSIIRDLSKKFKRSIKNSVSVHVRRGDYIRFAHVYPLLGITYYAKALAYIGEHRKIDNILIFSDDIPWCKENFHGDKLKFIEGMEDWEDMYLMSLCSNNIISNSSFSWWGSYLNQSDDNIVIAPKQWMQPDSTFWWKDIYTDKMILMDDEIINTYL